MFTVDDNGVHKDKKLCSIFCKCFIKVNVNSFTGVMVCVDCQIDLVQSPLGCL